MADWDTSSLGNPTRIDEQIGDSLDATDWAAFEQRASDALRFEFPTPPYEHEHHAVVGGRFFGYVKRCVVPDHIVMQKPSTGPIRVEVLAEHKDVGRLRLDHIMQVVSARTFLHTRRGKYQVIETRLCVPERCKASAVLKLIARSSRVVIQTIPDEGYP